MRTEAGATATSGRAALFESKLQPPALGPDAVHRRALLDRLAGARDVPVVSVAAPPGYGKTTLLSQWAAQTGNVAWLSLDEQDNDPRANTDCTTAAPATASQTVRAAEFEAFSS